ncbi:DUF3313 family protein [Thalassotalea eurytherma]|uniref:DUF3313 family protein n=1 Tax=Thalassotalea eurytherma TaxID=1144278 RepID=A0ABQ6H6E9_9GAMM|nr:DUF3313 family protein [Thalassotalea eurytherma]GLX83730.1 hypothetical protein theurythT_31830 [Thalassotalea eurytherma]
MTQLGVDWTRNWVYNYYKVRSIRCLVHQQTRFNFKQGKGITMLTSIKKATIVAVSASMMLMSQAALAGKKTDDGLTEVKSGNFSVAYIKEGYDFSQFTKIKLVEPHVKMKKNWRRDFNRAQKSLASRASKTDEEKIVSNVKGIYQDVLKAQFDKRGMPIVEENGADVLVLLPALINLNIFQPDLNNASGSKVQIKQSGSATVYFELYNSATGEILAKMAQTSMLGEHRKSFQYSNAVIINGDIKMKLEDWLNQLNDHVIDSGANKT